MFNSPDAQLSDLEGAEVSEHSTKPNVFLRLWTWLKIEDLAVKKQKETRIKKGSQIGWHWMWMGILLVLCNVGVWEFKASYWNPSQRSKQKVVVDSEGGIHSSNAAFNSMKIRDLAKIQDRSDRYIRWRWQQQAGGSWCLRRYYHHLRWLILELLSQQFGLQEFLSGEENESVLEAELCQKFPQRVGVWMSCRSSQAWRTSRVWSSSSGDASMQTG